MYVISYTPKLTGMSATHSGGKCCTDGTTRLTFLQSKAKLYDINNFEKTRSNG